jgi:hypothetical protein
MKVMLQQGRLQEQQLELVWVPQLVQPPAAPEEAPLSVLQPVCF